MKTLKFRAWDIQYKTMVKVTMLLLGTEEIDYEGNLNEPKSIDHFHLMQSTNILDSFGEEIFVGDIIENGLSGIWEVKSCQGGYELFCLKGNHKGCTFSVDALNQNAKIIGTIYTIEV